MKKILLIPIFSGFLLGSVIPVTVTAYTSSTKECDSTPFITATGYHLKPKDKKKIVAVSRDLFKKLKNKKITLKIGNKTYKVIVKDTMHHRWRKRVDLYFYTDKQGMRKFGKRKGKIID